MAAGSPGRRRPDPERRLHPGSLPAMTEPPADSTPDSTTNPAPDLLATPDAIDAAVPVAAPDPIDVWRAAMADFRDAAARAASRPPAR